MAVEHELPQPGAVKRYALDWATPLRFVASRLEAARLCGQPVARDSLLRAYHHVNPGDLYRVCLHEGVESEREAEVYLAAWGLKALGDAVRETADGLLLARPLAELSYHDRPITPIDETPLRFQSAFDPLTKALFGTNIRQREVPANDPSWVELRASMRAFGWLPGHPAIVDERGTVLVGHRRLKVAEELHIKADILEVELGSGDAADARRFQIAIGSNLGGKPMNTDDRRELAKYLYTEKDWSMARVAEALRIHATTVSDDLRILGVPKKDNRGRPPKGAREPGPRALTEQAQAWAAAQVLDEGRSLAAVGRDLGVSSAPIRRARDVEAGRRAAPGDHAVVTNDGALDGRMPCPHCGGTGLAS